MPKKKRSKRQRGGKPSQYKVVLADVFYKTLRPTASELAESRAKGRRLHRHLYKRERGYGVELYRCACGDGWGRVLGEERSVRY